MRPVLGRGGAETADKNWGRKGHRSHSQEVCPIQAAAWLRMYSAVYGRYRRHPESLSWVTEGTDAPIV